MANISRDSFLESKRYDKVILQQGVPLTDYDFNESQDIQRFKLRRVVQELFGDGALGNGFKVVQAATPNQTVIITAGVIYVGGMRVALDANTTFNMPAAPTSGTRKDYVYAEVTEQEIDKTMDPDITHPKLVGLEPTRRVKISVTFKSGASVPVDTSTTKYYGLAEVTRATNDNAISNAEIKDLRAVKATFEGEGFAVKGNVVLGDALSDIIDIQGTVKNTVTDKVVIDANVEIKKNLEVLGTFKSTGAMVQTGKLNEVARRPLFGIAGDIQYQSDARAWEDVTPNLYNLFETFSMPAAPSGATRKYKLLVAYSAAHTAAVSPEIRLINGSTVLMSETLPLISGATDGSRRYVMTAEFTPSVTSGSVKVQAQIPNGEMAIYYVELIAYDVY